MDLGLRHRTALVLGGGGGLGGAIARTLAAEGARVAVADLDAATAGQTVDQIRAMGGSATAAVWNLADLDAMSASLTAIENESGPIDILVNNTGGPPPTPVNGQSAAEWAKQFQAMVLSVIMLADRVVPGMRARKWGRVVTSASSGVVAPIPNLGLSNALRMSLVGWSKTLAREVGRDGVTCNVVVPGRIATRRIVFLDEQRAAREGRSIDEVAKESAASIPIGRYGDPQEYADTVAFLASAKASYITGSVIRVDGGFIPSV